MIKPAFLKSRYEVCFWEGICQNFRKAWMAASAGAGKPSLYCKPGDPTRISVPIHGNKDLKLGLLRHFMKQARLSEKDLT